MELYKVGIIELIELLPEEVIETALSTPEVQEALVKLEKEHKISIHDGVPYVNLKPEIPSEVLLYNGAEVKLWENNGQLELRYLLNHIFSFDYTPINNVKSLESKLEELYGDKVKAKLYANKLINKFLIGEDLI